MKVDSVTLHALEQGSWFKSLPGGMKEALLTRSRVLQLAPGEALFRRNDERSGLYGIVDGMARISGLNEQGKEAILTFAEAPDWIGEVALFDGERRTHDAFAEGSLTVLHMPQAELDVLLAEHPEYWRQFGLLLAHKLRLAFTAIEDLALLPAKLRLARRLVMIAQGYGADGDVQVKHVVSVSQEQLGQMVSISRQTTNQILRELAKQNLIKVTYGEIEIVDLPGLKRTIA
jgi:CRP/FNR family cyclic AMP-dependent transcriptional regulator